MRNCPFYKDQRVRLVSSNRRRITGTVVSVSTSGHTVSVLFDGDASPVVCTFRHRGTWSPKRKPATAWLMHEPMTEAGS